MKAEERANQKAGALVNRWIEPVYCDSEADDGFALRIPTGDEGRKYVQRLQELIADEILAAQREAEERMKERCAKALDERADLLYRSSRSAIDSESPAYDPDNAGSLITRSHGLVAAAKWLRTLPPEDEKTP